MEYDKKYPIRMIFRLDEAMDDKIRKAIQDDPEMTMSAFIRKAIRAALKGESK
jgi:Arc/MetJ-type ribon-helix-helix transcriptional regulator